MLSPDFKDLLRLFNDQKVEYLVVGGYAMAAHGHPRYTGDIDLWILAAAENAARIMTALRQFGFGASGLVESDFQKPEQVIQLGYPPVRIDLMTDIDGLTFADCWPRRIVVDIDGLSIPAIGLADLIRNKEASGRLQDLADLEKLKSNSDEKE
jgi:predicted nucleotidyltransferase